MKARAILLQNRERARRTIRSGGMIALEYIFHVLQFSEFEAYMVILSLSSELDHELSQIISRLNTQTYSRIPTIGLCIRSYADCLTTSSRSSSIRFASSASSVSLRTISFAAYSPSVCTG